MKLFKKNFLVFLKTRSTYFYILLLLLSIASILRFYNFPSRYGLGEETVRDAVIGIEGARQLQFPLTGAFSSLGPFTFGPWYQYQLIIATLLLRHVYAPWIYLSIISIAYVFVMYKIGELLIDKKFGIILAVLAVFSPAQVISATHLTSHNATNLFAVLAIWIFLKLIKKNLSYWWGFLLGFVIGIGMNLHFQMTGLLIFLVLILLYKPKKYLYFITGILGVFATFIPLLFFELNNHWFNVRNMYVYMLYSRKLMYVPNRWLFYLRDFWPGFWADSLGIPILLASAIIIGFIVVFGFSFYKKKLKISWILLFVAFLLMFISLRYYWGPRFYGYLNFLRPFVFIFTAYFIYKFFNIKLGKYIALGILLTIVLFSMPRNISQMQKDPFSKNVYAAADQILLKYPQDKFQIFHCSKKYSPSYNAEVFSMLFVLNLNKKIGDGIKIGIDSRECKYPIPDRDKDKLISNSSAKQELYAMPGSVSILDFSNLSEKEVISSGWKKISMPDIYNIYARWWFKEQP